MLESENLGIESWRRLPISRVDVEKKHRCFVNLVVDFKAVVDVVVAVVGGAVVDAVANVDVLKIKM